LPLNIEASFLLCPITVSKGITVKPWLKSIAGEAPVSEQLEIMRMAMSMARHAAAREAAIARNIAHADTPGYKAQDVRPFAEVYKSGSAQTMRATRPGHLTGSLAAHDPTATNRAETHSESPNGNSVSLETEILKSVAAQREQGQALTIYSKSLEILRMSLGRIR